MPTVAFLIAVICRDVACPPIDLVTALEVLESAANTQAADLRQAVDEVDQKLGGAAYESWYRALRLVARKSIPPELRARLVEVVTRSADEMKWRAIITLCLEMARNLSTHSVSEESGVLYRILDEIGRQPTWGIVGSWDDTVSFLGRVIHTDMVVDPRIRARAWLFLSRSTARRDVIRTAVLEGIMSYENMDRLWPEMIGVLDAEMMPGLRKIVRESRPLHGLATAALAHLGDVEIRAELVKRRDEKDKPDLAERSIWQIDVQKSNDALLKRIGAAEGEDGANGQRWALRRGLELGIEKSALRDAVLAFAARAEPAEVGGKRLANPDLIGLKQLALELGVLRADDLPDVPAPIKVEH